MGKEGDAGSILPRQTDTEQGHTRLRTRILWPVCRLRTGVSVHVQQTEGRYVINCPCTTIRYDLASSHQANLTPFGRRQTKKSAGDRTSSTSPSFSSRTS